MAKPLQRFDFGTLRDFRGPLVVVPEMPAEPVAEEPPPPPPPPTYSEDELQQARMDAKKSGYADGFAAGLAQAASEADIREQHADVALATLGEQVSGLSQTYNEVLTKQSFDVSELALLIAKKVAAEALDARSVEVISALVMRCLPVIFTRPRIMIELHPDTMAKAEARLKDYFIAHHYEGDMQCRANPALGVADARIDWGHGMAERSTATLWQDIELLLARVPMAMELEQTTTEQPTVQE